MRVTLILLFLGMTTMVLGQESTNQFDENGKRHGLWKKTYEGEEQLKFEGRFEHGKEVGTFKFYKPKNGNQPSSIVTHHKDSDLVDAAYYTRKGKLLSKGQLKARKRTGTWEYYHSNSDAVMMRETYKNDVLNGLKTTYFDNGNITDEVNYVNGSREGFYKLYSLKGVVLQDLNYVNDELHGPATYYNGKGQKTIEGQYKNGRKDGLWKYYKNGKVEKEKIFPIN